MSRRSSRQPSEVALDSRLLPKRQQAYAFDFLLWHAVGYALFVLSGFRDYSFDHFDRPRYYVVAILSLLLWRALFLCKDGLSGFSPGNWAVDLRVFRTDTGRPAGPKDSLRRNLILFIPIVGELIVWITMNLGRRFGDAWAHCQVVKLDDDP